MKKKKRPSFFWGTTQMKSLIDAICVAASFPQKIDEKLCDEIERRDLNSARISYLFFRKKRLNSK